MRFEDAMNELEQIATALENNEIELEDAIDQHERAEKLRKHCEKKLKDAKTKIEKIIAKEGIAEDVEEIESLDQLAANQ